MNFYDPNAMLSSRYSLRDLTATSKMLTQPNMPESPDHYDNLVYLADMLEQLESEIGPFLVLSSYRTSELQANLASAGEPVGSGKSFHELGRAVDISPTTMSITEFFGRLLANENLKNRFAEIAIKPSQNAIHLSINTPNDERTTKVLGLNSEGVYAKLGVEDITNYITPYMESAEVAYDYAASKLVTYNRWPLIIGAGAALLGILIIIKGFSDSDSRRVLRINPRKKLVSKKREKSVTRKNPRVKANPISTDQALRYFKEYIAVYPDEKNFVRDLISKIREYTIRDDQEKFLTQIARYKLYLDQISYGPSLDYEIKIKPFLKVLSSDIQKFNFPASLPPYDDRDMNVKNSLYKASIDKTFYIKNKVDIANTTKILKRKITDAENSAHHFLDLMYNNIHYKPLQKISWNKKPDELLLLLTKHEEIIQDSLSGKELITAIPEQSEDFLVINKNLKWVLIENNFCPYEEEIMGHCATAPRGCRLLSLREYSNIWPRYDRKTEKWRNVNIKTPQWLSRVTATVCPETTSEGSPMFGKFYITEILGPKNAKISDKWYDAVRALYEHSSIVEQKSGSYNAFMTFNLKLEDQEALYKKKPSLAPPTWAVEKATDKELVPLFLKEMKGASAYTWLKDSVKYKGDGHLLLLESSDPTEFFKKVNYLTSKFSHAELNGVLEAYLDPYTWTENGYDYYPRFSDLDAETYLDLMSKTQLMKACGTSNASEITKGLIPDELKEAMRSAEADGHRIGYENSISSYAYQVLKEAKFMSNQSNNDSAFIDHNKGFWQLWITAQTLRQEMIGALREENDVADQIFYDLAIQKTDSWRIEGDFDSDAAQERFKELVEELYGK